MDLQYKLEGSEWSFIVKMIYAGSILVLLIVRIKESCNPQQEPEGYLNEQTEGMISGKTRQIIAKHRSAIVQRILFARKFQGETAKSEASHDMNSRKPSGVDIPTTNECSICLEQCDEEIHDKILLRCNHMFHRDCLVPWLECSMSCPYCRASVFTLHDMIKAAVELKLVEE